MPVRQRSKCRIVCTSIWCCRSLAYGVRRCSESLSNPIHGSMPSHPMTEAQGISFGLFSAIAKLNSVKHNVWRMKEIK